MSLHSFISCYKSVNYLPGKYRNLPVN